MGEQFDKKIRIYVGSGKKNQTESGLKVAVYLHYLRVKHYVNERIYVPRYERRLIKTMK